MSDNIPFSSSVSLPKLGVDLTAPTTWDGRSPRVTLTGINPSAGLTTVLSITGEKGVMEYSFFDNMIAEDYTVKLTVDGEIKFNDTWTISSSTPFFNGGTSSTSNYTDPIPYDDSFLLEVQSTSDTSIDYLYAKRVLA